MNKLLSSQLSQEMIHSLLPKNILYVIFFAQNSFENDEFSVALPLRHHHCHDGLLNVIQ